MSKVDAMSKLLPILVLLQLTFESMILVEVILLGGNYQPNSGSNCWPLLKRNA